MGGRCATGRCREWEAAFLNGKQKIQAAYCMLGSLKMYKQLVNQSEFAVHSSVVARE